MQNGNNILCKLPDIGQNDGMVGRAIVLRVVNPVQFLAPYIVPWVSKEWTEAYISNKLWFLLSRALTEEKFLSGI